MKEYTDEQLLNLLKNDDEKAFALLYDRYWSVTLIKAYSLLGVSFDAEEIVQDVFTSLWFKRHRLQLRFSFRTYISAAIRYEVYAKIAGAKKIKDRADLDSSDIELADYSTQQFLEFEEFRIHVENVMEVLPDKCRLVFRLSRFEELSNEEIANQLNLSKKTVEAHITKALKVLRENLNKNNLGIELAFFILMIKK